MTFCYSDFATGAEFMKAVRSNRDNVFLSGRWRGKPIQLTLSTFLELSPSLVVLGPGGAWRVHVDQHAGRIITKQMRLARGRDTSSYWLDRT